MIYTNDAIKEKTIRKQNTKRIIRIAMLPLILLIIAFLCNIIFQILVQKNGKLDFWGYKFSIVMTGTMQPDINIGDIIIEKKVTQNEIQVGDMISYNIAGTNTSITHKVTKVINENGEKSFKTKGNNYNFEDPELVHYDMIEGKICKSITGLGVVIPYIFSKTGLAILAFIILTCYFMISNRKSRMAMRAETRKLYNFPKYEQKEG